MAGATANRPGSDSSNLLTDRDVFGDVEEMVDLLSDSDRLAEFLLRTFDGTEDEMVLLENHLELLHTKLSWKGEAVSTSVTGPEFREQPESSSAASENYAKAWTFAEAAPRMRERYETEIAYARYLHCCCEDEWERTWEHTQIFRLTEEVRELIGPPGDESVMSTADLEVRLAWDLISYIDVELKVETAQALALHRRSANQAAVAEMQAHDMLTRIEALDSGSLLKEFFHDLMTEQAHYYGALAVAADAVQRFLYQPGRDARGLIEAADRLSHAEALMSEPEDASELRAHRSSVEKLLKQVDTEWLRLDEGQIVCVYPFGLSGTGNDLEENVLETLKNSSQWQFGPTRSLSRPSYSLSADDIWNPSLHIPWFKNQYDGTRIPLEPICIILPEDDADSGLTLAFDSESMEEHADEPAVSPRQITFDVEIVFTNLGNHHLRLTSQIKNYSADVLASVTWLFAPECGNLREYLSLGAGVRLESYADASGVLEDPRSPVFPTISKYAMAVISGVGESISAVLSGHDIATVAREGMYHLVLEVSAASAVSKDGERELAHPAEMLDCFGGRILNHPVPAGMHAIAQWVTYDERPIRIVEGPSLNREIILMQENLSLLASFASPRYAMNGPREAIEFAVSLEGMVQSWVNRLQKYYYDKVVGRIEELLAHNASPGTTVELSAESIAQLELEQLNLRQFRTKSAITMLHINSPAFVTSMATRKMLDDFIDRIGIPRMYASYLEFSQDILESRLEELIISQVRTAAERRHERTRTIVDMAVIFAAMIGVSGVFALAQSGYDIQHPWLISLMLVITIATGVTASVFHSRAAQMWNRYTGFSREYGLRRLLNSIIAFFRRLFKRSHR